MIYFCSFLSLPVPTWAFVDFFFGRSYRPISFSGGPAGNDGLPAPVEKDDLQHRPAPGQCHAPRPARLCHGHLLQVQQHRDRGCPQWNRPGTVHRNALAVALAAVAETVSGSQQVLTELMLTEPEQMSALGGAAVLVFDQLQKETSVWESLLALPRLFTFDSAEQLLDTATDLLTNLKR